MRNTTLSSNTIGQINDYLSSPEQTSRPRNRIKVNNSEDLSDFSVPNDSEPENVMSDQDDALFITESVVTKNVEFSQILQTMQLMNSSIEKKFTSVEKLALDVSNSKSEQMKTNEILLASLEKMCDRIAHLEMQVQNETRPQITDSAAVAHVAALEKQNQLLIARLDDIEKSCLPLLNLVLLLCQSRDQ
jgi:hypothetical protein